MPRKLKLTKLEPFYNSNYGVTVDIYLDRNTNEFYGDFGGERIKATSYEACRAKIHKIVEDSINLDWIPVIAISQMKPWVGSGCPHFIGFNLSRFWVGRVGVNHYKMGRWSDPDNVRAELSTPFRWDEVYTSAYSTAAERENRSLGIFKPPCKAGDTLYLPYTEETYAALEQLQHNIASTKRRLNELLESPEGIKKITSMIPLEAPPALPTAE